MSIDPHRIPPQNPPEPHQVDSAVPLNTGPTAPKVDQHKHTQSPDDLLDEELMESFPASDPPSHTKSHT